MKAYALTDVGVKRKTNQDYVYINNTKVGCLPNLFIVADGMGGHKAGDIASRLAVESLIEFVENSNEKEPFKLFGKGIEIANEKILEEARNDLELQGMGTTLVVATLIEKKLYVANIGDSRLYLIRDELMQITKDHSYVEEMLKRGQIDESEARTHEKKNVITRAVGADVCMSADYFEVDIKEGDKFLMCSDGLTNMLLDEEIFEIISSNKDVKMSVDMLIEEANKKGGKDNIAIVLVDTTVIVQ